MGAYSLVTSEPSVQVISPTLTNPIQYCTIQTDPSGVIANFPVQKAEFDSNTASPQLQAFNDGIETIMNQPHVIGGVGTQELDTNGLLADFVTFTVQYVPPASSGTAITGLANVPVLLLSQSDATIMEASLAQAEQIVATVYGNLQSLAGG